jgi:hypothetical protein
MLKDQGFVLADCCESHAFKACERQMAKLLVRACRDRLRVSVFATRRDRSVQKLIIRS